MTFGFLLVRERCLEELDDRGRGYNFDIVRDEWFFNLVPSIFECVKEVHSSSISSKGK